MKMSIFNCLFIMRNTNNLKSLIGIIEREIVSFHVEVLHLQNVRPPGEVCTNTWLHKYTNQGKHLQIWVFFFLFVFFWKLKLFFYAISPWLLTKVLFQLSFPSVSCVHTSQQCLQRGVLTSAGPTWPLQRQRAVSEWVSAADITHTQLHILISIKLTKRQ